MNQTTLFIALLITFVSCSQSKEIITSYAKHVGDITFNKKTDDPHFKPCDTARIDQYYNFGKGLQYRGEKAKINDHFKSLKMKDLKGESGFLTIRFIVNCEGKTGWFRTQGMDNNYHEKEFDKALVHQLVTHTQKLDSWIAGVNEEGKAADYYQYLTFKLENGQLIEIMP